MGVEPVPSQEAKDRPTGQRRIGIVVVHGVRRHPRYATQDELAEALADQLNSRDRLTDAADRWRLTVTYPQSEPGREISPTLTTVQRTASAADRYDIVEAYWSPLTKHRTNAWEVVRWLYRNVFVPANTDARVETPPLKMAFDITFIGGAVVLALLLLGSAAALIVVCTSSLIKLAGSNDVADATRNVVVVLITSAGGLVAADMILQALIAARRAIIAGMRARGRRTRQRWRAVLTLLAIGLAGVVAISFVRLARGGNFGYQWQILLAPVLLRTSRALLVDFVVALFADVLVYASRDENDQFFSSRTQVVDVVRTIITDAVDDSPFGLERPYDEVIVMGHSLGSVIALDAIMMLYQAYKELVLPRSSWDRLRALVTYGGALEKARYFFEASVDVTLSSSYLSWQDAIYGPLFTSRREVLNSPAAGYLHWSNFWYWTDPVANPIQTYRSTLQVNEDISKLAVANEEASREAQDYRASGQETLPRLVCQNIRGRRRASLTHPIVHGDYINDREFWFGINDDSATGILDILERGAKPTVSLSSQSRSEPRVEPVARARARAWRRALF